MADRSSKLANRFLITFLPAALIALAYGAARVLLGRFAPLVPSAYFEPVILLQAARMPTTWIILIVGTLIPIWHMPRLRWEALRFGPLRLYAIVLAAVLAWLLSSYGYNHYLGQAHWLDRALLWAFFGLLVWHPAGLAPFLWWLYLLQGQFDVPLGGYSVADIRPLYEQLLMLLIFLSGWSLVDWARERWPRLEAAAQGFVPFWLLALCLHAANYLGPGIGKIELNWLTENQLANLWVSAYTYGWQANLPLAQALAIADRLEQWNSVLLGITLLVELGMVLLFLRRQLTLTLLVAGSLLHLGILALTGIFFWKWILLNMVLILIVRRLTPSEHEHLYSWPVMLTGLVLLAVSSFLFRPPQLFWYDSPYVQKYQVEVVSPDGDAQPLPRNFIRPYQMIFSKEGLEFISPGYALVGSYGATMDVELLAALDRLDSANSIPLLVTEYGQQTDFGRGQRIFEHFAGRYFTSYLRDPQFQGLRYPDHILTQAPADAYAGQSRFTHVQVRLIETWYDGTTIHTVGDNVIYRLEVASGR